jgi:prepilin-type N-terminal cleavage/methylation domain-containing protein
MKNPTLIQKLSSNKQGGFTIIEMVVVIAIFGIMAGLVLFKYKDFNSAINLENTSQDIALQIQKAENDALAGRYPVTTHLPPAAWRTSYGVYFDTATPKQFVSFFDAASLQPSDPSYNAVTVNNRGYISGPMPITAPGSCGNTSPECLNIFSITDDSSIQKICTGLTMVGCTGAVSPPGNISLVFTRPFSDLIAVSVSPVPKAMLGDIRIRLKSDTTGKRRDIVVTQLGQIRIESVLP